MSGQGKDLRQQTDEQTAKGSREDRMLDEETIQDLEVTGEAAAGIRGGFTMTVTRHGAEPH